MSTVLNELFKAKSELWKAEYEYAENPKDVQKATMVLYWTTRVKYLESLPN